MSATAALFARFVATTVATTVATASMSSGRTALYGRGRGPRIVEVRRAPCPGWSSCRLRVEENVLADALTGVVLLKPLCHVIRGERPGEMIALDRVAAETGD